MRGHISKWRIQFLMCLCGVVVVHGTLNPAIWVSLLARAFTTRQIRTVKMCKLTGGGLCNNRLDE